MITKDVMQIANYAKKILEVELIICAVIFTYATASSHIGFL